MAISPGDFQLLFRSRPICKGCRRYPDDIGEYVEAAEDAGMTPDAYVRQEEGTFNKLNNLFWCTACYIKAGQPLGVCK